MMRALVVLCVVLMLFYPCATLFASEVVESDVNKDGNPDGWTYVKNGNVEKQEIDINFDGKVSEGQRQIGITAKAVHCIVNPTGRHPIPGKGFPQW